MKVNPLRRRLTALLLVSVLAAILAGCTGFDKSEIVDGLEIYYSTSRGECFVGTYNYDGETTDITVPDEYRGLPVTRLGGYHGMGVPVEFSIDVSSLGNCSDIGSYIFHNYFPGGELPFVPSSADIYTIDLSSSDLAVGIRRESIPFTVRIGKNLREIDNGISAPNVFHVNADGSVTVYNVEYRFDCSPENSAFYSENGVLYSKTTGEAVEIGPSDESRNVLRVYVDRLTPLEDIVISPDDD